MPRTTSRETSAFTQVQANARELLAKLRSEIHSKESELKHLRQDESKLAVLTGQPVMPMSNGNASGRTSGTRKRINWTEVLDKLPKQFKAIDIRGVRGLKEKGSSEIFAAITRWIEAGSVKRRDRGVFERMK
jgi:SMC interacting uncharacterized protein involved in chromosome segregation